MRQSLIVFLVLMPFLNRAQNGDCITALAVCNDIYSVPTSPAGIGNIMEFAPGTCNIGGEFNSAWYVFTAQETGLFGFVLQPNNNNDDYDWSLYNITNNGCAGINSGASPEVSCNSFGQFGGFQGPTGISTALGGVGNSNGPGNLNGPIFNADLPVTAGQVYALVVMNFSATLNGYTLDFTSSNVSIFDNTAPFIVSVVPNCSQNQFTITLSEPCGTAGMVASNISISHNGTVYPASSVSGVTGTSDNQFTVTANGLGAATGSATLQFVNGLVDLCGNPVTGSLAFNLPGSITADITTTPSCAGSNGGIDVSAAGLGSECFSFTLNGSPVAASGCSAASITGLAPGTYSLVVNGVTTSCPVTFSATVSDIPLSVDAGDDLVLCDMNTALNASFAGGDFQWVMQPGVSFSQVTNPSATAVATTPGLHVLVASVTQGSCTITDGVSVTFNYPPDLFYIKTDVSCNGFCDGSIVLSNGNGSVQASIGGAFLSGEDISFQQLCAGNYELTVIFSPECTADYNIFVSQPPAVVASFEASEWMVTVNNPVVELINASQNADSLIWLVYHDMTLSFNESLEVTFPTIPGTYPVILTAFGVNGCSDTFLGNIAVQDNFQVFVPNAFTPDYDGINDAFRPVFSYLPERYEFSIFNRWGDLIFKSTDPLEWWTGKVRGGEHFASDGIYLWKLLAKGRDIKEYEYSGYVLIYR